MEAAERAAGVENDKRVNVSRETLKKGSDAETSANPNEPEKGESDLLPVLMRIADALEEIAGHLRKG